MKTYEEAIKEMAEDLKAMQNTNSGDTYNWISNRLSGKAEMVAFIYDKTEAEVEKDIMAAA